MKKIYWRGAVGGGVLLVLTIVLQLCARKISGFATWYSQTVYPLFLNTVGRAVGQIPFSIAEAILCLTLLAILLYGILRFGKPMKSGMRVGAILLIPSLLFLYTINGGINYYRKPFAECINLELSDYSTKELEGLCQYLTFQMNKSAEELPEEADIQGWKKEGVYAMQQLSHRYSCLQNYYPPPKELYFSNILSARQMSGIFVPFTMEVNFNNEIPTWDIPHTICHELSHAGGFMREEDAGFIGYLACISSENPVFRYSGYLTAWMYAFNELTERDEEASRRIRETLTEQCEADIQEHNLFWTEKMGLTGELSNHWNDTYLRINEQDDGIDSYGKMTQMLISYYRQQEYSLAE